MIWIKWLSGCSKDGVKIEGMVTELMFFLTLYSQTRNTRITCSFLMFHVLYKTHQACDSRIPASSASCQCVSYRNL